MKRRFSLFLGFAAALLLGGMALGYLLAYINYPLARLFIPEALRDGVGDTTATDLGIAGSAVVMPIMVGRCFGEREFPKILGMAMAGFAVGVLFGPFFMGKIFDVTGNYASAFVLAMGIAFTAGILSLFIQTDGLKDEFTIFS